jgi:hypothetical protein
MDEFYLPEEILEWIGLKKSEYLSKLIEQVTADDFQFDEYHRFEDLIPSTLAQPDWSIEVTEDGHQVKTYCRMFSDENTFYQIVIGVLVPDQNKNDVFVPIISFVTRDELIIKVFSAGKLNRPLLN